MLSHYHTSINPEEENDAHSCLLRMVGFNKRVLEAGCASGHVSEALHAQGCKVVGIEIDESVVEPAKQWVERVVIGSFDDGELWKELEGEFFDAVLFGDVLEHLKDPLATLLASLQHLDPSGAVVISVPNIAHADVKIALLKGAFPYAESGLLDKTHIHFFTKESLLELVREAGLVPVEFRRITVPAFTTEIGVQRDDVETPVLEAILADRESETYQFVLKAVRDDGARSLENLSQDLIGLSDKLVDEQKRYATLWAMYEANQNDLSHLRRQMETVKRVVPKPLRRLGRKLFSQH
jgi:O-antigen biosynthesis protein